MKTTKSLLSSLFLVCSLLMAGTNVWAANDPIVTKKVEGRFLEIASNIRQSIMGKGLNVAHVLPASGMLGRTGPSYGYQDNVYRSAEIFEFCSAKLSHKLSRANPDNIALCPFTISVYELNAEPNTVRITYRVPSGRPGSEEIIKEVVALIESIIEDAAW